MNSEKPSDRELVEQLAENTDGMTLLPQAYAEGKIVVTRIAYQGRIALSVFAPDEAVAYAAMYRVFAEQLDKAAAAAQTLIDLECDGSA